jgi:hypothetical protein
VSTGESALIALGLRSPSGQRSNEVRAIGTERSY